MKKSVFQSQPFVSVFALTAAMLWGWAYPLIKLGFAEFGISADMTSSKMLFAGIRFCISGLIILAIASRRKLSFTVSNPRAWWYILAFALLNTTLHYTFFYIGLSNSHGSRASIINSLSTFLAVILACFIFKSDKMSWKKALGCAVGISGMLILNAGGKLATEGSQFTWAGDGMIVLNAVCGASATLMARGLGKRVIVFVGTGLGLALGGVLLIVPGLLLGGRLPQVSANGIAILCGLIVISTVGFSLYNKLISCNPVGKVAIYNSLIPVIGILSSCACLGEPFYWKYLLSGGLAALGIYIINKEKKKTKSRD